MPLTSLGVGVGGVDRALRRGGRRVGLGRGAEATAVLHHPTRAVGLIGLVGLALGPQLLLETALGLLQTLGPRTRDRARLLGALLIEATLRLAQPLPATLGAGQFCGELITTRLAVELVLGRVDGLGLLDDLARDRP
jgi:hypothetical protein